MKTLKYLSLVAAAGALVAVVPEAAVAQLPKLDMVEGQLQDAIRPIFTMIRYVIVGICIVMGMWQAYKATQGDAKGWMKAILMWVVGGIAISPKSFFDLLGMKQLGQALVNYGLA